MTIYLVRHAHAGRRSHWAGPDSERPLSDKGRRQADALTDRLADARIEQVLSSASARCQETVAGLAEQRGVEVEVHPALTEGASARDTIALLRGLAAGGVGAALSSHGDVIPAALDALAGDGLELDSSRELPKGTFYALAVDDHGRITSAALVDPRP